MTMRSRSILLGLLIFASVSILSGVIHRAFKTPDNFPETPTFPTASSQPLVPGSDPAPASPTPSSSISPPPVVEPPAASAKTADLSMDADGLSRSSIVLRTTKGLIRIKFYPKQAPKTVARIIELVQHGFYNGLKFHRIVPDFLIQTGDPQGTGMGGSGVPLTAEFSPLKHVEGTVGMARGSDPHSADSQFYITLSTQPQLDRAYTVFGRVVEGIEVTKSIEKSDSIQTATLE